MTVKKASIDTDLKLRKFNIIQYISTAESVAFIEALEEVLRLQRIADYEQKMKTPMSRAQYEQQLVEANASVERGEGISHEDLIKEINGTSGGDALTLAH